MGPDVCANDQEQKIYNKLDLETTPDLNGYNIENDTAIEIIGKDTRHRDHGQGQACVTIFATRLANATPTHASHRLRLGIDSHFLRLGSIPQFVGISTS